MTMIGAREATDITLLGPLRRLIAGATAHALRALVVPGPDLALAAGLDLAAAGLALADNPRVANVLLLLGPLSPEIRDAASVAYAQMPRPRAVLALGADETAPLPAPDASAALSQTGLEQGLLTLRTRISGGAFAGKVDDFEAPALQSRIEYTCPMHPEIISDAPGSCPKCGMFLVPRETSAQDQGQEHVPSHDHAEHGTTPPKAAPYACPMHPEVTSNEPGNCPKCGMTLVAQQATQYTCPMHPEVTSDTPGNCPECGMNLVPVDADGADAHPHHHDHTGHDHTEHGATPPEAASYACPMHPEVTSDTPGNCPKCGMTLVAQEATQYTCPMHPEVTSNEPGNCPKCGMTLVRADASEQGGHDHTHHDHAAEGDPETGWLERIEPGFMSMIEMTEGTPRSSDSLQMEWIDVPFGPFFPGLPGGLTLLFTLDGDSVVKTRAGSLVGDTGLPDGAAMPAAQFVSDIAAHLPLAPTSYRLLACRAIELAAGTPQTPEIEAARDTALERERIASHLLWLAQLGRQLGLSRIAQQAATLQLAARDGDLAALRGLTPRVRRLMARIRGTRFLARRLDAVGQLPDDADWRGPGLARDSAAGRLAARLTEIERALEVIGAAAGLAEPALGVIGDASGHAEAKVATPRGTAHLHLSLEAGKVVLADLDTPSARHAALIAPLCEQRELGDALVAVASLDLDPWEIGA